MMGGPIFASVPNSSRSPFSPLPVLPEYHQYLLIWGMFFTRYFPGPTRIYSGYCHYSFNSGIDAKPAAGQATAQGKGAVVFSVMEANKFQHLVQDLLYVIDAHRVLLRDPQTAIALPENPHAETLLRLIGIKNPIVSLPWRGETVLPGPVTVVDFATYGNPATDDREWGRLCARAIPYRRNCLARLRAGLDEIAPCPPRDLLLWISRRGARTWADEAALAAELGQVARRQGLTLYRFAPDDPAASDASSSLMDRLCLFRRAKAVVAVHGGAAYHVVACQPGTAFLEVTVPKSYSFDWWIDAADLRYRRYRVANGSHFGGEPVVVSAAEVARHLEETLQAAPVPARGWLRPDHGRM
jgi:hypothetical protein